MLLLFDLDGTLYQTEYTLILAVNALFDELKLPHPDQLDVLRSIGKTTALFLDDILPSHIAPQSVAERFQNIELSLIAQNGKLYPGVPEMLDSLKAYGHTLCVVSNGSLNYIELVLKSTGIRDCFSGLYSAKYYDSKALLVKELVETGDSAAVIGDTILDISAAKENSLPSVSALYGYGDKQRLQDATLTAQSAAEIDSCIKRLKVFSDITDKLVRKGKRVIGISGIDTSGKTRFTEDYARFLNDLGYRTAIIHMDDYHNPLDVRRRGSNEIDAYYAHAFNNEQLIGEVLEPLKRQGYIDKNVLCLNLDTDRYENTVHYDIDKDTVVLLEGVLLFRPTVTDYLEGRVFLKISFDEMLKRARERDVPRYGEAFIQKYIDKYIPVQKRYLEENRPQASSDIVIDNNNYLFPKILAV